MSEILIEHNPSPAKLEVMGVFNWPIWEKEESVFPWSYDERETCYLLEGEAVITPEDGDPVTIEAGDLVTFPKGMKCQWEIKSYVSKHYDFG